MNAVYDDVAGWYDQVVRRGTIVHDAALLEIADLVGDVTGKRVLDLACGQGIVARFMARCGANVLGVDVSESLLDFARREELAAPLGISYGYMNAEDLGELPRASFDGVVCNMALMDIADLQAAVDGVTAVLRNGGWFVFSIMHPCFQTPGSRWLLDGASGPGRLVSVYFTEGRWFSTSDESIRARVGAYHRTLSTYLNALAAAGMTLEKIREPSISREEGRTFPAYDVVPGLLCARAIKRCET